MKTNISVDRQANRNLKAEKYKKIDVLKAQRSLDTDYQKKRLEKLEYSDKWNKEHPDRYNKPEEK